MKTFCGRANPTTGAIEWEEEAEDYDYHQEIARSSYADMLHDKDRNEKYDSGIRAAVCRVKQRGQRAVVLDIGTGTGLLSMMAVRAGADYCYAVEVFKPMADVAQKIVDKNGFSNKIKVINKHSNSVTVGPSKPVSAEVSDTTPQQLQEMVELVGPQAINLVKQVTLVLLQCIFLCITDSFWLFLFLQVSLLIGEPFFTTSLLPWHNLYFWYARTYLTKVLRSELTVLPQSAVLLAMAVEFENLWRIRAPCGVCEGFNVSLMDEMIQNSLNFRECQEAEPHPLWEYPCRGLSDPCQVLSFDFRQEVPEQPIYSTGSMKLLRSGTCHGVVLWMDYSLTDDISISTGLTRPCSHTGDCNWNPHCKQGVYFLSSVTNPKHSTDGLNSVVYDVTFHPESGEVAMDFKWAP
ncbi:protein arginine N-methyltransferase 7 [Rhincodon typus]|uniref:protein arginine N-methyltransferase 7 n=1 Tax=Rhincodon typus TaxID=259920 RepID=UPI00202E7BE2|nr:protein arginine N-methyltransferase 7 [Rhincodon typus]